MDPALLCDRCLGRRLVGARGAGSQTAAGEAHRVALGWAPVPADACPVCEDAWQDVPAWVQVAQAALAPFEAQTLQVGTRFPTPCEEAEREVAEAMGQPVGESLRTESNRLLAPLVAAAVGAETVTEGRPDIAITVDTRFWTAEVRPTSVYVRGRYTKHRRDLPQTHWPCKTCHGRGCFACDDHGVLYPGSVEDEIARVLVPAFGASGASFHGAGREDIDALMLGTGRPFILELHEPRRRTVDLAPLEAALTGTEDAVGVAVQDLRMAQKEEVAAIKGGAYDKAYLAHCETQGPVTREDVEAAADALSGAELEQRTPERVSHRRADLVRKRTVHEVELVSFDDDQHFTLRVLAGSGTYIKEFVNGDGGRTTPSFAQRLGTECRVEFLDVVGILDD